MYPKVEGDNLREWMCTMRIRMDHVSRLIEKDFISPHPKLVKYVKKRCPAFCKFFISLHDLIHNKINVILSSQLRE